MSRSRWFWLEAFCVLDGNGMGVCGRDFAFTFVVDVGNQMGFIPPPLFFAFFFFHKKKKRV